MDYYVVKLTLQPNTETTRDVLAALLAEAGYESFVESPTGLHAFVPADHYSELAVAQTLATVPLPGLSIRWEAEPIASRNWNSEWEQHFFQPTLVDGQVLIHSSFHTQLPSAPYRIVIDPKMAFGTGHHATTALMLSLLLPLDLHGKSVVDMGCGTALLAIFAKMKGAAEATAIDIDPQACANAEENIRLNHTPDIRLRLGDVDQLGDETYDVILANITRNTLLRHIPIYAHHLRPSASLLLSGFYAEDAAVLRACCEQSQLHFVASREKENWMALHFTR
jgi:ribosomal protein L11 methyltransferase